MLFVVCVGVLGTVLVLRPSTCCVVCVGVLGTVLVLRPSTCCVVCCLCWCVSDCIRTENGALFLFDIAH